MSGEPSLFEKDDRVMVEFSGGGRPPRVWSGDIVEYGLHPAPYLVLDTHQPPGSSLVVIFLGPGVTVAVAPPSHPAL